MRIKCSVAIFVAASNPEASGDFPWKENWKIWRRSSGFEDRRMQRDDFRISNHSDYYEENVFFSTDKCSRWDDGERGLILESVLLIVAINNTRLMYKKDTSYLWDYYTENNSIYIHLYPEIGNNELKFQFVLKVLYQTADR